MPLENIRDWILPIFALAGAMIIFERRLARLETRVEIILSWLRRHDPEEERL